MDGNDLGGQWARAADPNWSPPQDPVTVALRELADAVRDLCSTVRHCLYKEDSDFQDAMDRLTDGHLRAAYEAIEAAR